jgi:two-component sensor histidine kinase
MTATPLRSETLIANLREIARALSAAWDVDSTLDLIARKTAQVMQVESCSIYLLDREGETLWLRASTGLAHASLGRTALKMGQGLTGWAAQHGEPVAVRDAQSDPRFYFLPQTRELNFKSLLAVPLVNRNRVIGALNVQTRALHAFTEEEVELAALISDLAAGAIDRALLYDSMNRQITELTTLAQVSETVNAPLYLDEMLAVIVEMAAKVMGTPVCTLRLLDEARQQLVVRAAWSTIPHYQRKASLRLDEGINGIVVRDRRPVALLDVRADDRYPFPGAARREGLVSLLSVPLIVRERVIGVLNCYTTEAHAFSEPEMALAATLANQTALAIENAQLVTNAAVVREMHHRVRNNLQTVALLLRMQTSQSAGLSARDVLPLAVSRILSIAAVHDVLAQEGYRLVDVKDVCERIARHASQSMVRPDLQLDLRVAGEELVLPSKLATSLALVVNELLQNALEHAFSDRQQGLVHITLGRSPQACVVEVTDDGVGFPDPPPPSLGLEIVEALVHDDLRGRIEFLRRAPHGTQVVVRFPQPAIDETLE